MRFLSEADPINVEALCVSELFRRVGYPAAEVGFAWRGGIVEVAAGLPEEFRIWVQVGAPRAQTEAKWRAEMDETIRVWNEGERPAEAELAFHRSEARRRGADVMRRLIGRGFRRKVDHDVTRMAVSDDV